MATKKPRLVVTLEPSQAAVIQRVAALQGRSQASVVREVIEGIQPVLERLADLGEAFQRSSSELQGKFREAAETAEADILPQAMKAQTEFLGLLDMLQGMQGDDGEDPRPVITGVRS